MADCELLAVCHFFNERMANMPVSAERMKDIYCRGHNANCARYMVYKELGSEGVPGDLYPNYVERARRLLAGKVPLS